VARQPSWSARRRACCCSALAPRSNLRGGDIDLLVELSAPVPDRWSLGNRLGARIERQLGLQKIDILVTDPETPESTLLAEARRDGIPV